MNLIFRLSKDDPDLKDPEIFFTDTLIKRDDKYFYDSNKRRNIDKGNTIYFLYDSKIIAIGIFDGEILENRKRSEKYIYGHKLKNIQIINSKIKMNYQVISTRTTYVDTKEKQDEINRAFIIASDIYPEEVSESIYEGAKINICVNSYERSKEARDQCLKKLGYSCSVCGVDFQKIYGSIGNDFIHVHHMVPLHVIDKEYIIDPLKDLAPVCPNCHSMIHKRKPPYSIKELKEIVSEKCPEYIKLFL